MEIPVRPADTIVRRRATRRPRGSTVATGRPRIVHIAAELWPFAWSGGLGHAVADLAAQQARHGSDAIVVVPLYRSIREKVGTLRPACEPFHVHQGGADEPIQCVEKQRSGPGSRVVFVDHPASFDRPGLYGDERGDYADNDRRFAILVQAALEFARRLSDGRRLVVHAHDWHAALAPVYMRVARAYDPDIARMASVVSVHNAGYQGLFHRESLGAVGLPDALWSLSAMEWYGQLSYLKGGLRFADVVTTVSATHADEIRSDVGGFGLHDAFRALGDRLVGIRNGIDNRRWDPEIDDDIPARYGPAAPDGKRRCKHELQLASRLPPLDVPLFAMSARLVKQKGIDLILASRVVRDASAQFVFLGQGEPNYETALSDLAREYPQRIALRTNFADRFEHQLLAGADFLLMPSLYEPCGLTQMRAQRYGTLPVARRVGGLAETIVDGETGFLFDAFTAADLDDALERAQALHAEPAAHRVRAAAAMCRDFSWTEPLALYDEVYRRALAAR